MSQTRSRTVDVVSDQINESVSKNSEVACLYKVRMYVYTFAFWLHDTK